MGGSNETHSVPVTTPERQSAPSNGVGTQRSPTKHSPLPTKKQLIWSKVEAFAWLCAAAFALWYGDGRNSIVYIIMYDINVKRCVPLVRKQSQESCGFAIADAAVAVIKVRACSLYLQDVVLCWAWLPWSRFSHFLVPVNLVSVQPVVPLKTLAPNVNSKFTSTLLA